MSFSFWVPAAGPRRPQSLQPGHDVPGKGEGARFLAQPKDYGKPWFGQLMAGPQMLAYFLRVNAWMEDYGL